MQVQPIELFANKSQSVSALPFSIYVPSKAIQKRLVSACIRDCTPGTSETVSLEW